ncbi:NADPH oxidase organizer 1a [Polymixia lowei]
MEAQRYPVTIRLIGVLHKEKSKMYMTSVLWSDQNDIVVYRSFRDFKKMHKQMKKSFPSPNPLKKSDRIIPKFRDKRMRRPKNKGPSKSVVRLQFLEKYCNDLLSCDPRVTQSPNLIQFFHPKDQDLQPEFASNSIMIMPSEGEGRDKTVNVGNVTKPFVTETHRCIASYDTKDTKNKPFNVAVDEEVDVLIKDKGGWWLVENENKQLAWFPAPYLENLEDDGDDDGDEDNMNGSLMASMLYTAVKSYKATKADEVSVDIGSVVEVLQKSDNGWWLIRYNNKAGYVPTMFLQPYNNPRVRMAALQQDLRSSTLNLSQLQPPSLAQQSHQYSRSQGNLLQLPGVRPSSPRLLQPADKYKSHSLNILSMPHPAQPTADAATVTRAAAPIIMVQMDGEEGERSPTPESKGSFESEDSEFSFSDDLSSSSGRSSLNLSLGNMEEPLRLSRTPPPVVNNRLSPTSGPGAKIMPSVSDPNLFKGPTTPKVPPRPRAQEILSRCTTVTRKNASRLSPAEAGIVSR